MPVGMIGRKVGMMRLYDGEGRVRAVTAIELGPNRVTQLRTHDQDGYEAVQIGFVGNRKRMTRPQRGHLRKAGIDERLGVLREFRADPSQFEVGQEIRSNEEFTPGEYVDVTGTSKGRGFAGGVKRWHFAGGPKTHGQSDRWRAPGSIGAGTTPGKVWKGQKMGGHMGAERKTVRNLLVVLTDESRNLIFVEGSVPGPNSGVISVKHALKRTLENFQPPPALDPAVPEESDEVEETAAGEHDTGEDHGPADETADEAVADAAEDAAVDETADETTDEAKE